MNQFANDPVGTTGGKWMLALGEAEKRKESSNFENYLKNLWAISSQSRPPSKRSQMCQIHPLANMHTPHTESLFCRSGLHYNMAILGAFPNLSPGGLKEHFKRTTNKPSLSPPLTYLTGQGGWGLACETLTLKRIRHDFSAKADISLQGLQARFLLQQLPANSFLGSKSRCTPRKGLRRRRA